MKLNLNTDRLIEISGVVRRLYGLKLLLVGGLNEESKWFLYNREKLKYMTDFLPNGLVLDFGAYVGDFTAKLSKKNPSMLFKLYEPVPQYYQKCAKRFEESDNIEVFPLALSSDGRGLDLQVDGPRTKLNPIENSHKVASISINSIFQHLDKVELLKMNIEGMEYECLLSLIKSGQIAKVKFLLIQFHNFSLSDYIEYGILQSLIKKDFTIVFRHEWKWEMWKRNKI